MIRLLHSLHRRAVLLGDLPDALPAARCAQDDGGPLRIALGAKLERAAAERLKLLRSAA